MNSFTVQSADDTLRCRVVQPVNTPNAWCVMPRFEITDIQEPPFDAFVQRIVDRGFGVVAFESKWCRFETQVAALRQGIDTFTQTQRRISEITAACKQRSPTPSWVALLGISRFGYAAIHAMAQDPSIDAVAASSPVTHWPTLREFAELEGHAILDRHDLGRLIDRLPPRPMMMQIGRDDARVDTARCRALASQIALAYTERGVTDAFDFHVLDARGHETTKPFFDRVAAWLERVSPVHARSVSVTWTSPLSVHSVRLMVRHALTRTDSLYKMNLADRTLPLRFCTGLPSSAISACS